MQKTGHAEPRAPEVPILTQDALDGVMLDELQVRNLRVGGRRLYESVALASLLNHHLVRQTKA